MALASAPTLDTDNVVSLVDDTELDTVGDSPLEAAVNVLLPDLDVEVGLVLGEEEGPDATVKVRILQTDQSTQFMTIDDIKNWQLTLEALGLRVTIRMGHTGRYLERRRAVLPLHRPVSEHF